MKNSLTIFLLAGLISSCGDPSSSIEDSGVSDAQGDADPLDSGPNPDADGPGVDASLLDGGAADAGAASWPDSGTTLAPPEWAELTVGPAGSCPAFVPCGGDVVGTWDTHGGCFELDIESAISRCPGAMVTRRTGRGRGRVVFGADGLAHRVAEAVVDAELHFPAVCASFFSCEMLEAAMAGLFTTASCTTQSNGDCSCNAQEITAINQRSPYRTEGNEIVSIGSDKRWEFCASGDFLDYRDTSPSEPREPGVVRLLSQ